MRVVIQRVKTAKVEVDGKIVGKIDRGLVVLLGIAKGDGDKEVDYLIKKILTLRIFREGDSHFQTSIEENDAEILLVSQFTLYADTNKGRRPDFGESAQAKEANELYELFKTKLEENKIKTQTGVFGADMDVTLTNEGPVTIIIESK